MPEPSTSGVTFPGMPPPSPTDAWLRAPLPGIDAALMPAAHALVQAREVVTASLADAEPYELWACPGGARAAELGRSVTVGVERPLDQLRAKAVRGLGLSGSA